MLNINCIRLVYRWLITSKLMLGCVSCIPTGNIKVNMKPNIVFILADDLGYGDLQCYGNPYLETPAINKLAQNGILFTNYYSPSPLSAPARASILTGMYNHRTGAVDVSSNRAIDRIALSYKTMGDYFKKEGYSTGMIGKWHNGLYDLQYHPNNRGFKYFFGFLNGIQDYWNWNLDQNGTNIPTDGRYLTDVITDGSLKFIEENKNNPFLLFISHHAPHTPYQAPDSLIEKYIAKGNGKLNKKVATIYSMIESMDSGIEKVISQLDSLGLKENTIIVFTSDNGAQNTGEDYRFQAGLSGTKGIVLEGGIRVPAIISWPNHIPKNKTVTSPLHGCDWLPTLLKLSGSSSKIIGTADGKDISNVLLRKKDKYLKERTLYFQKNRYHPVAYSDAAIIEGEWKLYWPGISETMKKESRDNPSVLKGTTEPHWEMACDTTIPLWNDYIPMSPLLFNLVDDPSERYDLSAKNPVIVNELVKKWDKWFSDVMEDYQKSWKEIKNVERMKW